MKYTRTILVTDCEQLYRNPPQCGQWIQLAWCDKPSRFISAQTAPHHIMAFHYPTAVSGFNSFFACRKEVAARIAANRAAREVLDRLNRVA